MKHWKFYLTLRRYLQGSLSETEKQRFDRFLEETELRGEPVAWSEEEQAALLERINKKIHSPMPERKRMSTPRFIAAATLVTVMLLGAYYAVLTFSVKHNNNVGEVEKTRLSDGTLVWLKASDKLSYYETPDRHERHATLTGEALFEVAKDPSRPFIIQCGTTLLRVIGTSFTLRATNDSVMLTVLTGRVHVYSEDDTTGVDVLPNERMVYAGHGPISTHTSRIEDVPSYVRTTEYNMRFTDVTVEELAARIEEKFDVEVTLDATVKRCHVTADFTDHSLEKTLNLLAEVLDITYTVNGTAVAIHGNGCQGS